MTAAAIAAGRGRHGAGRARVATWETVASGTTIRPRRPGRRSRADHAVTASRSRSMRYWSAMSTANDRHEARGQHGEHHHRGPDDGRREVAERREAGEHEQPGAAHHPDPQRLVGPGCERPADGGRDGGGQPDRADDQGQPLRGRVPQHRQRRCRGERRSHQDPLRGVPPDRQHADHGRGQQQSDRDGAQVALGLGGERAGEDGEQAGHPEPGGGPRAGLGVGVVWRRRPGRMLSAGGRSSSRPARRPSRRRPRRARRRAAGARRFACR